MPEPFTASVGALSQGVGVFEKIGILEGVKNKLVNNPDIAASKLAGVLNEIGKTYEAVDEVLVQFASMSFEDDQARQSALTLLNKTRGGHLKRRMMEARAKRSQIWVIFDRYLRGWFSRALAQQEQLQVNQIFIELGTVDGKWIEMLDKVAQDLERVSETYNSTIGERQDRRCAPIT